MIIEQYREAREDSPTSRYFCEEHGLAEARQNHEDADGDFVESAWEPRESGTDVALLYLRSNPDFGGSIRFVRFELDSGEEVCTVCEIINREP